MKMSIVFSSLTGNTMKVAYKILEVMPEGTNIFNLKDLDHEIESELLVLGYWVDRAKPNKEMYQFMEKLEGKKVITFGTLGAEPASPHAFETINNTDNLLKEKNEVLGNFLCQGRINPKITEMFMKNGGLNGVHAMTVERIKRHQAAASHPDEQDFKNAQEFVHNIIEKYLEEK
ncbi:MAG: flavodoxin [Clostridiales bacterium]|nr:flavodoxin [Clostridiales bacterium]